MATTKQIQRMMRHPAEYMRFRSTGQLPKGIVPTSPLLDILTRIPSKDRCRMLGFEINQELGYAGRRRFQTVEQAMRWLAPDSEVFGSFPAESWRIKGFCARLSFDDVVGHCACVPDDVLLRHRS